jgi:ribose/xylose/arabinose/galactoside ABC-type transport system permease subunit
MQPPEVELEPASSAAASRPTRGILGLRGQTVRLKEAALQYVGVLTVLLVLVGIFSYLQPQFRTWTNFLNILQTNATLLTLSVGLTFVLLIGGFDLSIGGVLALSGVLVAKLLDSGAGLYGSMLIVIVGGILVGIFFNGFPIARLGANFFMITLGVSFATRGIAFVITNGSSIGLYNYKSLQNIGNGGVGQFGYLIFISIGILVLATLVIRYTGYGRMIYAVGGNAEAARLAGINVVMIRISAYAICAGLAAFTGFLEAGRLAAAAPDTDTGIEFTAAAAVLLGGTSFVGGVGTMFGTFLGVLFLGVLQNGLIISSINIYWQNVITGAVLVLSVLIDRFRQQRSGRMA